jgi:hypothetical protein
MFRRVGVFLLKCAGILGVYVGLEQLIELKTLGFCLQNIQADDVVFQRQWETAPLENDEKAQIARLLAQPYYLIGAGSECFAFKSEDGQAVIKFFKLNHTRPVYFNKGLFAEDHSAFAGTISNHPLARVGQHGVRRLLGIREFRIQRTFNSIKLAYDELKEETGLLYLHLNPTDNLHQRLALYDGNGIRHEIDLDSARFFLQQCAVPLERHFTTLCNQHRDDEAKKCIDTLLALILNRCKKGFADRDIFNKNLGFIGVQAIEIDTGSFHRDARMQHPWIYKQELFYATLELKSWFKKHYPQMVEYLDGRVSEEIHSG